jgi:Golgi nucleoside diphosphatase
MFGVLFSLVNFLFVVGTIESRSIKHGYLIAFDAGSKNTRMSIFSYTLGYDVNITEELYFPLGDGGLAAYENLTQVRDNFGAALTEADKIVPCDTRNETIIFLGATAGMRLLEYVILYTKA